MRSARFFIFTVFTLVGLLSFTILVLGDDHGDTTLEIIENNPIPARDPADLIVRLQGADPDTFTIASRPEYEIGDTEIFEITGSLGGDRPEREMVLAAETDAIYIWIELGMDYDPANVQEIAETVSAVSLPIIREHFGQEQDVEGDPHIYVLTVNTPGTGVAGVFDDSDRYPDEVVAGSDEINSVVMAISTDDVWFYSYVLTHELQHLVQADQDENEETWIVEGAAELGAILSVNESYSRVDNHDLFVSSYTHNQLTAWSVENALPHYGAAALFLGYVTQRYGEEWVMPFAQESADGAFGIDRALTSIGAVDPLTNEPATFNNIFADFVIANFLNDPDISDGRFGYTLPDVNVTAPPNLVVSEYPADFSGSAVNQYGTTYIELESATDQVLTINFTGENEIFLLPIDAYSGDYFLWSQKGNQGNSRLTGSFDLRDVDTATLNFWMWYDIEELWDYGYISVSTDDGDTWEVLTTPDMTSDNPFARAFTTGLTGISGDRVERPAPFIGFASDDYLRINRVIAGTPAEIAGLEVGDLVTAMNGRYLNAENFFDVIDQFNPGDTITLRVNRDGELLELDVELGLNAGRSLAPQANWVPASIDLSPYTGSDVLVRFDYVTDQAASFPGWVLDDVEIPEINFFDDMESDQAAWTREGWVRINNVIPQDYFIQLIEMNNDITTVSRLLEPGDDNTGSWTVEVGAEKRAVLAISGAALLTEVPTTYNLEILP